VGEMDDTPYDWDDIQEWRESQMDCDENGDSDMSEWGGQRRQGGGNGKPKYEHKQNKGSMFDNDHKEKETQPDFTGSINVEGVVYWINGWKNTTQNGKRKLALSVQRQDEQRREAAQPQARKQSAW